MKLLPAFLFIVLFITGYGQSWNFKSVNLQGMGYVTGIIAHPTGGLIYARTDVYGIYKWDSVNSKWVPTMDGKVLQASIESFAIDPGDENTVYAVGGNNQTGRLYKSTNQGDSWIELPNFKQKAITVLGNGAWRGAGERLAVDPNNKGQVLYFGTRTRGLWKSSDNGTTWAQVATSLIPAGSAGGVIFVIFDPSSGNTATNSQKIYVGVLGKGIYATTNEGASWELLTGGPATNAYPCRATIANNGIMYVSYASSDGGGATGFVYKYSGSGSLVNVTPAGKSNEGFWGISVDPNNADWVSTYQWNPENGKGIHFSSNGGTSWTSSGFSRPANRTEPSWYPTWAGWTYCAGMVIDPLSPAKVWLTTGFAAYRTDNINSSSPKWTAQMRNFEELVVTMVKCPPVIGGADLIAGFAVQQGFRIANKDIVPAVTFEPNGFGICTGIDYCEADPNFIVTVGGNQNDGTDWESKTPKYRYSTNNGLTWTSFTSPTATSVNGNVAVSCSDKNRWVIAPKDRRGSLNDPYLTTDAGKTWTKTIGTPANTENGCTEQWSASEFLIADKINGMTFYYYSDQRNNGSGSGFYRSIDGGANFTQLYTGLPASYKSQIAAVPGKEGNVFYCSKTGSSLYLTTNGGSTWNVVTGVTNCSSVGFGKAVAPSPEPTVFIYATVNGKKSVYQSTDFCKSWVEINDGTLPTNISNITGDMRTQGLVYLATGGRGIIYGVYSTSTSSENLKLGKHGKDEKIRLFPNPAGNHFKLAFNSEQFGQAKLFIYSLSGTLVYSQVENFVAGENIFSFSADNLKIVPGMYIFKVQTSKNDFNQKILISG